MSCNSILGIPKGCDGNNIGGIREIYIIDQEDVTSYVIDGATHTITGITASGKYETFTFSRNVGNFTTEETRDLLVGSNVVKSTLTITLNRREGSKSRAISILGEGQRYLSIIVKAANGTYTHFKDMQLMSSAEDSGTAKADGSKYTLTFSNEEENYPYFVTPAIVPALLA